MDNCMGVKDKKDFVESKATVQQLSDTYNIEDMKVLGAGSFGKVYIADSKKDKSIQVAIKVI